MTENEAKQKWCPFVRFTMDRERVMDNRGGRYDICQGTQQASCIGSGCMAWRRGRYDTADEGYCGLAGARR